MCRCAGNFKRPNARNHLWFLRVEPSFTPFCTWFREIKKKNPFSPPPRTLAVEGRPPHEQLSRLVFIFRCQWIDLLSPWQRKHQLAPPKGLRPNELFNHPSALICLSTTEYFEVISITIVGTASLGRLSAVRSGCKPTSWPPLLLLTSNAWGCAQAVYYNSTNLTPNSHPELPAKGSQPLSVPSAHSSRNMLILSEPNHFSLQITTSTLPLTPPPQIPFFYPPALE